MATLAQIQAKATTVLSDLELEKLREIIRFDKGQRANLRELADDMTPEERQATRADFDDFDSIPSGAGTTAQLGGDGSGLTYDGSKDRAAIRERVLLRLGLAIDSLPQTGGIYSIAIPTTWYQQTED